MKKITATLSLLFFFSYLYGQKLPAVNVLTSDNKTSLRGLSVVTDDIIWASGNNGMVARSVNGGKDWKWIQVKGFEKSDFRDIEAFDASTAVIMAVADPAYMLRTTNGGESWQIVFENKTEGMFLDAMEFWNEMAGIVIGDPVNGKIFVARTFDGGQSWKEVPYDFRPVADSGEAMFAASGTNIRALDRDEAVFVTGGSKSRLFIRDAKIKLPVVQGTESTGANSIAVWDNNKLKGGKKMIVVGGDFSKDSMSQNNCFYTNNRGASWQAPKLPPRGYKSCVEYVTEKMLVTCGTSGVDVSKDGGETWQQVSAEGFHVCRRAKDGKAVYLAGSRGRIAKLVD